MKKTVLSLVDLNMEEMDLSNVKGGREQEESIYSGCGLNGITGKMVHEWVNCYDDGSFEHVFI